MESSVQLLCLDHVDERVLIDSTDHRDELTLRLRVDDGVDEGFLLLLLAADPGAECGVVICQILDGVVDLV